MSDRNLNQPYRPRETERYAELSDLLGDVRADALIAPREPIFNAGESASLESALASVDANYPLRPREVSISASATARSWQTAPGAFSRATPVAPILEPRGDRKSTRLNSSHPSISRMPSSA